MKKIVRILQLLTLCFWWIPAIASTPTLSPNAQISLLTLSPGEELYSTFGHSALRVTDIINGIDKVYNYGTFDFGEPGFYIKFIRGKLNYQLSTSYFEHTFWEAQQQQRTLIEQVLALTPEQKQRLFNFLEWNALPENRNYRYDFFFDNCSTRIRDAIKQACGDSLQFNLKLERVYTFRQLLDIYLDDKPYPDFGMDIGQGTPSDQQASPYQAMFLPEFLLKGFESATLLESGKTIRLVSNTRILYQAPVESENGAGIKPIFILSILLLLVLGITWVDIRRKKQSAWLDVLLFGTTATLGLLLLFLWVGTDHTVTKNNWNLVWAFPGHWLLLSLAKRKEIIAHYWLLFGVALITLLIVRPWLPQEIDGELIPVILALSIRALFLHYRAKEAAAHTVKKIRV